MTAATRVVSMEAGETKFQNVLHFQKNDGQAIPTVTISRAKRERTDFVLFCLLKPF